MMQKTVFTAIVGRPNAGKSSIMNRLLGQKIAIVSNKPQTTRTKITGVLTNGETQFVFIDTPGLHKPHNALGEKMNRAVGDGMCDTDCCVLVADAQKGLGAPERDIIKRLKNGNLKAVLAINKTDLLKQKEALIPMISEFCAEFDFEAVVPVSAVSGDGLGALTDEIEKLAKPGVHMFDDDTLTDQPERVLAAEMVREKLLRLLQNEVPHGIASVIERFSERENGILDIDCTIYCERDSHKGIVIGKGGSMLKKVGEAARIDMENFFGCKVNLKLWVKVKENWRNSDVTIHNFGLD